MAMRKRVKYRRHGANYNSSSDVVTMPVMSYSNDGLAELIVRAWSDGQFVWPVVAAIPAIGFQGWPAGNVPHLKQALLERDPHTNLPTDEAVKVATNAVNILANMDLQRAVVITEAEHDDDYTMQAENEVVFVLPDDARLAARPPINQPTPVNILETAKVLMACTPNGI